MTFGNAVVTFVKVAENDSVRDRYGHPAETTTSTDVPGCLFRPVSFKETSPIATQQVLQRWKCTAPPVAAAMGAAATDEVIVDGVTYQIVGGAEVFSDFNGPFKVTLYCDLQIL